MAKTYHHYGLNGRVENHDQVPSWMDAVVNAPAEKKRPDPARFKDIWP